MIIQPLLTPPEAGLFLNLTNDQVAQLVRERMVPHILLPPDSEVRFDADLLLQWAKEFAVTPETKAHDEIPT